MTNRAKTMMDIYDGSAIGALSVAKRQVQSQLDQGSHCPCCGQYCKVYPRKFTGQMAAWLIWMYKEYKALKKWRQDAMVDPWIDVKRYSLRGGDYAKTAYWGLAERKQKDPEDTSRRTSGLWKPTVKGEDFIHRRITIPSHAFVYNNEVRWFSGSKIDIVQALGNRFNYEELMSA